MNQFLELFGGPIAVFLSIIATIFVTLRWKADRDKNTRRFLVALLYWTPLFLLSCMALHCFQNAYRAIISLQETGVFNFYYYSLQLFGFVVGYQACLLLKKCRQHAAGERRMNPGFFRVVGLLVLTTLPTFAFTPIGIIPTAVVFLASLFSVCIHKPEKAGYLPTLVKEWENREVPKKATA